MSLSTLQNITFEHKEIVEDSNPSLFNSSIVSPWLIGPDFDICGHDQSLYLGVGSA